MTDIDLSEATEAAAEAVRRSVRVRPHETVIDAIERAVREQIAREIDARMEKNDAQGSADFSEGLWSGLNEAKHIAARGEQ